tara:strand:- start:787 stop:1005 length:219 start_codon:yes stop_codon:yes gene_type:complete
MKRFSIGFTEEEYRSLEAIRKWYEQQVGVKVSKCAVIKRLLFDGCKMEGLFSPENAQNSDKKGSKRLLEGQV